MPVKKGDFIRLDYTGKIQETNEVFDTTNQEVAEEAEIFSENKTYGAIPIVVGSGHILPALDDAVEGMKAGEEKTVEVSAEDGFGKRDPNLLQMVPMREFKKQGIKPQVGMAITSEGHTGIIRTVSGGRVTVDFNHELAGKNLEYQVKAFTGVCNAVIVAKNRIIYQTVYYFKAWCMEGDFNPVFLFCLIISQCNVERDNTLIRNIFTYCNLNVVLGYSF